MSEYSKPHEYIVEILRASDGQTIDELKMRLYDFPVFQRSKNREFELYIFSEHYENINDYTLYKTYNHPIYVEQFPYIACPKGHRNDVYLHKKQRDNNTQEYNIQHGAIQEHNTQENTNNQDTTGQDTTQENNTNQNTNNQNDIDYDGIIVKSYGSNFLENSNDSYVLSHTMCKEL